MSTLAPDVRGGARELGHKLFTKTIAYFCARQQIVSEAILVPMAIFSRIVCTHDAIETLIAEGFYTEAAVLVLTQLELRLDIAYTASLPERATEWLSHEDRKWQVMTIGRKIKTLFTNGSESARLEEIAQYLHGIKHGNPVYSELGFPMRFNGHELMVSTGPITDEFTGQFAKLVGAYSVYQLAWASHVLNLYIAKYAKIDRVLRYKVRDLVPTLHPAEEELQRFLGAVATRGTGAFGMKPFKRRDRTGLR
jgi:hypothetical protein